ncbi:MAG: tripartite tricarboxylate transporter substrate binding protein [Rhodospirillaceae bacterium]
MSFNTWAGALSAAIILSACGHAVAAAADQSDAARFPARPVRAIVPYAPGGGTDILARVIGEKLYECWQQPLIVDNRPGGGTVIGTELVARAPADGYTLLVSTGTHAVNATLYRRLPFDPVRGFEPVSLLAIAPNVLVVHPSLPAKSVQELIALARAKPGVLTYSSSGNGGTGHLAMEMLKQMAQVQLIHIPYKGAGPALNAVVSGEASLSINNMIATLPQIKSGRLRVLAVTTEKRSRALPQVPTIAESGLPGFDASGWFGVWAPAKTPAAVVTKLSEDFRAVLAMPQIAQTLDQQGAEVAYRGPVEFRKLVLDEVERWRKVITSGGIAQD